MIYNLTITSWKTPYKNVKIRKEVRNEKNYIKWKYYLLDVEEYVSETVTVLDKHREYEVIDLMKFYFIELPKFRKQNPDMNDKLNQWLSIIDDTDGGKIKMAEQKNKKISTAQICLANRNWKCIDI